MRGALVVAAFGIGACHRAPPAPVVAELSAHVSRVDPSSLPMLGDPALEKLVTEIVSAVPGPLKLAIPPPAGAPRLRLVVEMETAFRPGLLRSALHARLEPVGEIAGVMRIDREALVEKEDQPAMPTSAELSAHVRHALELVAGGAMRGEQLWLGPPEAARAALSGGDADLRDEAVRIAGERRDTNAVPSLLTLLKSDDAELRDRTIGALAEIGDPRAARPLADLAKLGELDEVPKILDAISRVGGSEAETYLDFVAGSHSNPEIRSIAKRALEHLRARGSDAASWR